MIRIQRDLTICLPDKENADRAEKQQIIGIGCLLCQAQPPLILIPQFSCKQSFHSGSMRKLYRFRNDLPSPS